MTVRVIFFAAAKEILGTDHLEIQMTPGASVADLNQHLATEHPELAELVKASNWSVNQVYAQSDQVLSDGDEVGMIVPVSGG